MSGIITVIIRLDPDRQFVAAIDLCPSGQSGPDVRRAVFTTECDQIILIPQSRPGTDEAHVACQDIDQLRQLVQTAFPQKPSDTGDVGIRSTQQMGRHVGGCVGPHGSELDNPEICIRPARSALEKKNRSRRVQTDRRRQQQQQWTGEHNRDDGEQQVRNPLYAPVQTGTSGVDWFSFT